MNLNNLTEADGRALAVDAISVLDDESYAWSIDAMYRAEGTDQKNIILSHLDQILMSGNREVLAGFTAVLTDYIGSILTSGEPYLENYLGLSDYDVKGRPGAWPKMPER